MKKLLLYSIIFGFINSLGAMEPINYLLPADKSVIDRKFTFTCYICYIELNNKCYSKFENKIKDHFKFKHNMQYDCSQLYDDYPKDLVGKCPECGWQTAFFYSPLNVIASFRSHFKEHVGTFFSTKIVWENPAMYLLQKTIIQELTMADNTKPIHFLPITSQQLLALLEQMQ